MELQGLTGPRPTEGSPPGGAGRRSFPRPPPPAGGPSLTDRIFEALLREILAGRPPPGEKLPSEGRLAARFQAARVAVREAIARLQALSVVRARKGSGSTVLDWRREGGLELLPALVSGAGIEGFPGLPLVEGLLASRRALLLELLPAASRRRVPEGLDAMRRGAALARIAEHDLPGLHAADTAFARGVAEAAGNLPAALALQSLARPIGAVFALLRAVYGEPSRHIAALDAMLAAVLGGAPDHVSAVCRPLLEDLDHATLIRVSIA